MVFYFFLKCSIIIIYYLLFFFNFPACVNCVRWNGEGRLLASGGDDKLIMIWKQTASSSFPSGGCGIFSGSSGPETWRCQVTLRGHDGDVLDLAWSPDDRWLASCSIDNSIIVWDALKLPGTISISFSTV